jgi:uncharacterized protein
MNFTINQAATNAGEFVANGNAMPQKIIIDPEKLAAFCRKHHIQKLAFFGSVLRPDFRPDSDIEVLVEFVPGQVPGLAFFTMQKELGEILGRRVDMHTPQFLSRYFRPQVLAEAEVLYAAPLITELEKNPMGKQPA